MSSGDLHDRTDIARRVCKSTRSAVLRVWLSHAIFQGDLEILAPQVFSCAHFDGIDHEFRPLQRLLVICMPADGESRLPFLVQPVCQAQDDVKRILVPVHQPQRGAAQFLRAQDGGQRIFAERGASRADDSDGGWKGHGISFSLSLRGRCTSARRRAPNVAISSNL